MSHSRKILILILVGAFVFRVIGLGYGLPLWVVADEPPFIFGALKMLELRTLIPALHATEFKDKLYFPPYLSYLYLVPFVPILASEFLFFHGSFLDFKNSVELDPSLLFLIARFISVLFGVATVFLVYLIAKNIFASEQSALFAAAFLALSYLHVDFSHWARHWVPATFFFALVFYVLSRPDFTHKKRYLLTALISGVGTGINYQVALSVVLIVLWFFFYDHLPVKEYFKKRWVYGAVILFLGLFITAYLLYPNGLVISKENVVGSARSLGGFLAGYGFYFQKLLLTEPSFLLFIFLGLVFTFFRNRKFFVVATGFIISYIALFYFLFFHLDRYILMLYPIFAVTAGYGLAMAYERIRRRSILFAGGLVCLVFLSMAVLVIKLDFLFLIGDTRIQARQWINASVPENSKIMVMARLMRLPSRPEAIQEQEKIDPSSLRSVDRAELVLSSNNLSLLRYHALNLYSVASSSFFENIVSYSKMRDYQYAVTSGEFLAEHGIDKSFGAEGTVVKEFPGFDDNTDDVTNGFGGGFMKILALPANGPTLEVRKL